MLEQRTLTYRKQQLTEKALTSKYLVFFCAKKSPEILKKIVKLTEVKNSSVKRLHFLKWILVFWPSNGLQKLSIVLRR